MRLTCTLRLAWFVPNVGLYVMAAGLVGDHPSRTNTMQITSFLDFSVSEKSGNGQILGKPKR